MKSPLKRILAGARRLPIALPLAAFITTPAVAWTSARAVYNASGYLTYPADGSGNKIPDFSNAGYLEGASLPSVPVVKTISAVAGDNTASIQAAINAVAALPLQSNGYRGKVLMNPGLYTVLGTIYVNASGVVLAGSGHTNDPATSTVLQRTGTSTAEIIIVGGNHDDSFKTVVPNSTSNITDAMVYVGSRSFNVDNPGLYAVGDSIVILHPSTQAWINAVDTSGVWSAGQVDIRYLRKITAISGTKITIDAPVFNTLNRSLAQSTVYQYDRSGYVTHSAVQNFFIDIVTNGETSEDHCNDAITFVQAQDCWAHVVAAQHFVHSAITFGGSAIHCTARYCRGMDPNSIITGGRRYNLGTYHAQLCLFDNCYARGGRHSFVANGASLDSGNVFYNCTIDNPYAASEGHRLWPTALLYDNVTVVNYSAANTDTVIGLYNRGTYGSGHGWAAAHSVVWSSDGDAGQILVQQPPTAQNYAIGCFAGTVDGNGPFPGATGYIEGTNTAGLSPGSLYTEQLSDRLNPSNTNIARGGTGYGWKANTSSTSNGNRAALAGLNDNNLTADVDLAPAGDAVGAWEGAGVVWTSGKTITQVKFVNGTITSGGDGFLTANCKLQFSTDGTTWTDSGWTISPAYPYSSAAGGQTYTFTGTAVHEKLGARVVGQVRTTDTSYHWIVKEVQVTGH